VTDRVPNHALVLAPFSQSGLATLKARMAVTHESWMDTLRLYDPDELAERINELSVTALIVESDFVFVETFEQVSTLRFVGVCRAAINHVDVDSATEHGIVVVNTPGRNSRAVAEHIFGLMLSLARQIPAGDRYVKAGNWSSPDEPYRTLRGVELGGRTLGLVGFGAIGRQVATIAAAMGMTVLAHDPYISDAPQGVALTDLDSLLAGSDFVATLAPLNAETTGMLDADRLARMKPGAFLVTASGVSIADQPALLGALRSGAIRGLAVDVFDTHPVAPDSPLLTAENVVLTPHIAGATEETIARHSDMIAGDLIRLLDGETPINAVNPEVLSRA
jgi:D-3-phosphoglycerate dehydrogenase / 2-oxoglutarate reductase